MGIDVSLLAVLCAEFQTKPAILCCVADECRRLPVVDEEGKLTGLVSVDESRKLLVSEFHEIGRLLERESPRSLAAE